VHVLPLQSLFDRKRRSGVSGHPSAGRRSVAQKTRVVLDAQAAFAGDVGTVANGALTNRSRSSHRPILVGLSDSNKGA
jgi:hypothetical protein